MVWLSGWPSGIVLYDLVTGTKTTISDDGTWHDFAVVSGKLVVFTKQQYYGSGNYAIFGCVYDRETGQCPVNRLTSYAHQSKYWSPDLSGNKIVWHDHISSRNMYGEYVNGSLTNVRILTENVGWFTDPKIEGNLVVWNEDLTNPYTRFNIYALDINDPLLRRIPIDNTSGRRNENANISGNEIIWISRDAISLEDSKIERCLYNVKTESCDIRETVTDPNIGNGYTWWYPEVSGKYMTYVSHNNEGVYDTYLMNLYSKKPILLSTDDGISQFQPKVWQRAYSYMDCLTAPSDCNPAEIFYNKYVVEGTEHYGKTTTGTCHDPIKIDTTKEFSEGDQSLTIISTGAPANRPAWVLVGKQNLSGKEEDGYTSYVDMIATHLPIQTTSDLTGKIEVTIDNPAGKAIQIVVDLPEGCGNSTHSASQGLKVKSLLNKKLN
ncbi:MAG: hypothetical protein HQL27_01650 [Candidatus Omnitrophica bacterium]|nr:hypothetical protein [Candidatus Omnitrophota bacterium]